MKSGDRKAKVLELIQQSKRPLSASALAAQLHVSRQIIVGDVALLRASGIQIIATPRGYVMEPKEQGVLCTVAVMHDYSRLAQELYTIVDQGAIVLDVIVEHAVYGQLSGKLHIASRYDVEQFMERIQGDEAKPLSSLTSGLHLNTIQCKDEEMVQRVLNALKEEGFLYEKG